MRRSPCAFNRAIATAAFAAPLMLATVTPARAADITLVTKQGINTPAVIRVAGYFDKPDYQKFEAVAAPSLTLG